MSEHLIADRYRLESLLGQGGMSEVWRAEDEELERTVALKLLAPDADRARFDREARAAASLGHPNITQIYDYGEAAGRPYMVLEYLARGSLEDRLTAGPPLRDDETALIGRQIAAGLAHAHERGIVHRDLKPANVLFDSEGRAKIADLGIARRGGVGGTLTEAGTILGTAAYISPEQARGEPAIPASDVYSFGVILFRLLTGRLPFEAAQPLELVAMHRDSPPPKVADVPPDAPPELAALADASLAKDPADRPADGRALLAAFGTSPIARPPPADDAGVTQVLAGPAAPASRRRLPRGALAAILVLLAIGGAAVAYAVSSDGGTKAATTRISTSTTSKRIVPSLTTSSTARATPPVTSAATTAATTAKAATTAATTVKPATTAAATAKAATTAATTNATTTNATTAATTVAPPTTTAPAVTPSLPTTTAQTLTDTTLPTTTAP